MDILHKSAEVNNGAKIVPDSKSFSIAAIWFYNNTP